MHLQPGQTITAPFLPAPAAVKKFEPRTGYYLLEVVLDDGRHTFKPLRITAEQLAQIEVLERNPVALTADAEDFFYLIEAHRIHLAHSFRPVLTINTSLIEHPPHRNTGVSGEVLPHQPLHLQYPDDRLTHLVEFGMEADRLIKIEHLILVQ